MQEEHKINRLIEKYLAGNATPAEELELDKWFERLHAPSGAADRITGEPEREMLGEKIYAGVENKIRRRGQLPSAKVIPLKASRSFRWRLAASVISAAIVTAGGLLYKSKMPARRPLVKLLDLYTHQGGLSKIILTDSSVVWLNANSHLRYPEKFSGNRTVFLQGEAYFDIHQDPLHPFIIESNGYRTQVLGTTFSIRSYPIPNIYKVTVASGKVAVYNAADSSRAIFLTSDQEVRINGDVGTQEVRNVRAAKLMAWTTGGFSFEKDPLAEVVVSLENRYGTKFRLVSPVLKKMEITGAFDHKQSLDDILKILSKVYNLHFNKQPDGVINIS